MFRSFHRGTISLGRSKRDKVAVCKTLRMNALFLKANLEVALVAGEADFFSDLQLQWLVALQTFNLQRLTVPVLKDLNIFKCLLPVQKIGSIFNSCFALSKWPHFHSVNLVGNCRKGRSRCKFF